MHPTNKHHRNEIGKVKSKKRVIGLGESAKENNITFRRNTTKPCSCAVCGNPRKFFYEKTIKEQQNEERWKNMMDINDTIYDIYE